MLKKKLRNCFSILFLGGGAFVNLTDTKMMLDSLSCLECTSGFKNNYWKG